MEHLKSENFGTFLENEKRAVIVDFSAVWCGPCKMMTPVLEQIEKDNPEIAVANVDVDEAPDLAAKFGIMSIPAFILFEDGKPTAQTVGYMPAEELLSELGL